ncbi:hypothetical protein BXZ70DRAFT_76725 [Cristinia sonorae]|uniref:MYND-type domain-containing protein n=1 Tax=Cristinia sonorae TaxID=1940300 RepID=A0A8K0URF1_9AGAR|nr:hypothetical protein BXZ70DRAFT_76725 [Cristinia sonorae]
MQNSNYHLSQLEAPIPRAPGRAHPASDPKQQARKELTQCQTCYESKADGVTLFKCAGCKFELYCSKACQKKAWPTHKVRCRINQSVTSSAGDVSQALHLFSSKHQPTIGQAGMRALQVATDITRCQRDVLVITLRTRPGKTRPETAFFAVKAEIRSIYSFGEQSMMMKQQLDQLDKHNKEMGAAATLLVILSCIDVGVSLVAPVSAWKNALEPEYEDWEEDLKRYMNGGILR